MVTDQRELTLLDGVPDGLFIGGVWRPAHDDRRFQVFDPATGRVVKRIADASPGEGVQALDAAVEAFPAWAATPARERAEILRRAFDLLQERKEEFALLMRSEEHTSELQSLIRIPYAVFCMKKKNTIYNR